MEQLAETLAGKIYFSVLPAIILFVGTWLSVVANPSPNLKAKALRLSATLLLGVSIASPWVLKDDAMFMTWGSSAAAGFWSLHLSEEVK